MIREIDFPLYLGKNQSKMFGFTNDDDTIYNMTGSTVKLYLYLTSTPLEISGAITLLTGKVVFNFLSTDLVIEGKYEYRIEETKLDSSKIPLIQGNILLKSYIPFSETIEAYLATELPANITLTENYRVQRITYWKRFLMGAFGVVEGNINIDSSWTVMQNALIAKLVAYDALMLAAKGSLLHFFGGDYTQESGQGGPISKIETGPANVEFFSTGQILEQLMKAGPQGSALDTLSSDICGLAQFLKVKLPMCKYAVNIPFRFYTNEDFKLYPTEETTVVSQGDITI